MGRDSSAAIDNIMGKIKMSEVKEAVAAFQKARSAQDGPALAQHISSTQAVCHPRFLYQFDAPACADTVVLGWNIFRNVSTGFAVK